MLDRMQTAWSKKKDDCIAQIDNGGQCDYDKPEQLALRAAYPLAWLRFTAATTLFDDSAEQSKKLLNQSIDGFTASMLAMPDPNLIRENTLGRAYCERELGKFDHAEYDHAIADFKKIMEDGTGTQQYAAAQQGLSTTYAKMGKAEEAAKILPVPQGGKGEAGQFMLQLQTLFQAEKATSDPGQEGRVSQADHRRDEVQGERQGRLGDGRLGGGQISRATRSRNSAAPAIRSRNGSSPLYCFRARMKPAQPNTIPRPAIAENIPRPAGSLLISISARSASTWSRRCSTRLQNKAAATRPRPSFWGTASITTDGRRAARRIQRSKISG